jgi:hypothetical protein
VVSELEFEKIVELINEFKNKKYSCKDIIEDCLWRFIEELDKRLKDLCDNWCFVELYDSDSDTLIIAIGLLDTVLVELEYDIEHTVKITNLSVKKT